ncbi:MAG TPA: hypothetical protein VFJ71_06095, partial [Candidatus Limnocylindrales bacterium]|nr:hypothetical protein [Candidatus Limnocylindrales bacterium]
WIRLAAALVLTALGAAAVVDSTPPVSPASTPTPDTREVAASTDTPPSSVAPASAAAPSASAPTIGSPSAAAPTDPPAVVPATTTAIRPGSINKTSLNLTARYAVTLNVGWTSRSFGVSTILTVTNTSGAAVDRLELNTIAARLGGIRITVATVDGKAVTPSISDQTIRLPLGGILDPGASATVRVDYRATLRSTTSGSSWLFTRANGVLEAHRWIPWISRATPFDRPNHGDPFVTPVSPSVTVRIVADRTIRWATTGEQTSPTGRTTTFGASNVRDFVIVGAPDFRTVSATLNGVAIHVWYRSGFPASTVLAAARTALSRESRLLGAYPYKTYDLAQTAGGYGMESPGLTWIPTGAGSLPYLVAHETAHQWFYGIVGNDQARNPYADEAAADMVARHVLGLRRASRCATARLDLTIYSYSATCYYEVIYIQGGNFLDDTRARIGSTAYWDALRDYIAQYRFKLSSTKRLLDAIDAHTSLDLRPRYHTRFPSLY